MMGAAMISAILALVMPLPAHSRCLSSASRCGMVSESLEIGQVLPQLQTTQTRLLFQWVEEEEHTPSIRGRRPQRPRRTPARRRDTRPRRARRDTRRPRRTQFPEGPAAPTSPLSQQSCPERLRLGEVLSCEGDSLDRETVLAEVQGDTDVMREDPRPVAAADVNARPDDAPAQEPDAGSTDTAARTSAGPSESGSGGDGVPTEVEDGTAPNSAEVPPPAMLPGPAQGPASRPASWVATVRASAPPAAAPAEAARKVPVPAVPEAEGQGHAGSGDGAEVALPEGSPPEVDLPEGSPPAAAAPVKDDQAEEERDGGTEAGRTGQEVGVTGVEGDAAGSGPGLDPSAGVPAEGAAAGVPVGVPSATDGPAVPRSDGNDPDAMGPENTGSGVAAPPAADGEDSAERAIPPSPPPLNPPAPESPGATSGAPSDPSQAESAGNDPAIAAAVPLEDDSGKRIVCVDGESQSFGQVDGRKPNGITVTVGGSCRLSEWAGGFDGYWSVDAGDGHEDGLATAVKLMLRETGARVGAEVGRNNARNAGVNSFMKEMRDRADPVNLDYPEDVEIADGGLRKANIRKASDACSRMITVREC